MQKVAYVTRLCFVCGSNVPISGLFTLNALLVFKKQFRLNLPARQYLLHEWLTVAETFIFPPPCLTPPQTHPPCLVITRVTQTLGCLCFGFSSRHCCLPKVVVLGWAQKSISCTISCQCRKPPEGSVRMYKHLTTFDISPYLVPRGCESNLCT